MPCDAGHGRDPGRSDVAWGAAAGVIASALAGLAAIWVLLRYLQNHSTDVFVIYRLAAAVAFAGLLLAR